MGRQHVASKGSRVGIALVIGFVAGVYVYIHTVYSDACANESLHGAKRPGALPSCEPEVVTRYFSSELESTWLANAAEWEKDYCQAVSSQQQQQQPAVQVWKDSVAKIDNSNSTSGSLELSPAVYSRFETTVTCGSTSQTFTTWIEPLSHGLRHPEALCGPDNNRKDVGDMSYLLLAQQADVAAIRDAAHQACTGRNCQSIYMDLGATTWDDNDKVAGQGWFVRHYAKHGIDFDRMLLWEARPVQPPSSIFATIPQDLFHKYQYFNIPATADSSLPSHPVNMLKRIAQPGDFVVFKLDIDNSDIEVKILNTLLNDATAFALVDEFYFEHHVNFEPMKAYWGDSIDKNTTLTSSYQLFLKLRQTGWRAHSWV